MGHIEHKDDMSMGEFSETQKAFIEKLAWTVGDKVGERLKEHIAQTLEAHTLKCEIAKEWRDEKSQRVGRRKVYGVLISALTLVSAFLAWVIEHLVSYITGAKSH